jgi:hypothetical protein
MTRFAEPDARPCSGATTEHIGTAPQGGTEAQQMSSDHLDGTLARRSSEAHESVC